MKHESIVAEGHVGTQREQIDASRHAQSEGEDRSAFTVLAVATLAHIGVVVLIGRWIFGYSAR